MFIHSNRNKRSILFYIVGMTIILEICDMIWLSYLYPGGEYYNRGVRGAYTLLIFPILLIFWNSFMTVIGRTRAREGKGYLDMDSR